MSASNIAPFYSTDLEAKVACVLDRSAFLDSVTDAINHETKREDAKEMVAMMAANGFVPIIAALLTDRESSVRRKAYLALGNMIASEDKKMSFLATTAAVKALDTITDALGDNELRHSGAFVFANIAQFLAPVMAPETRNNMRNTVDNVFNGKSEWTDSKAVLADLLRAAQYLGACYEVSTPVLLTAFEQKWSKCFNSALHILSNQISKDSFGESYRAPAFQAFRTLLLSDKVPESQVTEFFFALSNLVVEPGVADMYLNDDLCVTKTCDIIRDFAGVRHSTAAYEASFVLANGVARQSSLAPLSDTLLERVEDTLLEVLDRPISHNNKKLQTAIEEALNTLGAEKVHRADLETEKELAELLTEINNVPSSEDMEIDTDDDYTAANLNLPCEINTPWPPAPNYNQTLYEYNPPSALDILARLRNNAPTSAIVNNLIRSVETAGGAFVPLPENTILTVADLSALEARGFSIVRGALGINAALTTVAYGF
jgi:hypothetical protein